eukprot:XP_022267567.1 putative uncharacterized protein C10orf128 homolog isoform X2 [Canis lupus familiaris]
MGSGASMLRAFLLLLDIKYAVIGAALGGAIAAVFLALKVCMIKKHLFDIDSSNLRSTTPGFRDTVTLKKRVPRSKLHFSESHQERGREAETQAEGEVGSMHREPDVGFDPGSPVSRPGPKAGAKPLRHPGIPEFHF